MSEHEIEEQPYVEGQEEETYDEEEVEPTIEYPYIATRYSDASRIVNEALELAQSKIAAGKSIHELCTEVDAFVEEKSAPFFKKTPEAKKGIAIPTCVTLNNGARWFSPDANQDVIIQDGDMVKVEVGVHMDGEVSSAAFTTVCGAEVVTGRAADVMCAAYQAGQAAYRMIRPGVTNDQVTDVIGRVCSAYNCKPVVGSLSHIQSTYVLAGHQVIVNKPDPDIIYETFEVEPHEVYGISILVSTGEGVVRDSGDRPHVYKRDLERRRLCRNKSARELLKKVQERHENFPFAMRTLSEDPHMLLGLRETLDEELIVPQVTMYERKGELIAHFKFTVMVYPNHNSMATDVPPLPEIRSEHAIEDEEILEILNRNVEKKRRRRNRSKKAQTTASE